MDKIKNIITAGKIVHRNSKTEFFSKIAEISILSQIIKIKIMISISISATKIQKIKSCKCQMSKNKILIINLLHVVQKTSTDFRFQIL